MKILTPPPPDFALIKRCIVAALLLFPGTLLAQTAGTVTIAVTSNNGDRDPATPGLQVNEGDQLTYTVTAHGLTGGGVVVQWDGSGTANVVRNTDTTTGFNIAPGNTFSIRLTSATPALTFPLTITDDTIAEGDETFTLTLRNDLIEIASTPATFTAGTPASVTVTILANDGGGATFTVTAGPTTIAETNTDAGHTYTITRTGDELAVDRVVTWTVNHTDTVAADFAATTGTVNFAAGDDSKMFTVTVIGDSDNESTENFSLSVAAPGHAAGNNYAVAITDDDDAATINATITGGGSVMEGDDATVTVTLAAAATTALSVAYTITPGTATAADYSDTSGGSITIASGETSGDITIGITDDAATEPAETFSVTITATDITGGGTASVTGGTQTFTIAASDAPAGIAVTVDNAAPREGDSVTFTVTLSGGAAATVDWNITGDADDYDGNASGSLSFTTAGSRTVAIAITDDDIIEGNETLTFTLSNATGADITVNTATVTITDNDVLAVTIRGPSSLNLNTTATYTVDLGGRVLSATTVTVTGVDDITIPIGERSADFTVAAGNTERTLLLTATANGVTGMLTVTITADNSAARAERATVPVASVAQSVGQLASTAIGKRLTFSGGSDFVNPNSFALTAAGSGINFWGSGGQVSANGEINGTTYDADTTAWHIGADTSWNDGLIGIALARTDSETDFTAAGVAGKLETDITSVHPYAIRKWNDAKVWGTLGYGSGDAELIEVDTFKSDLTILSLAAGVTVNAGRNLTFTTDAHWNRAELSGGNANGKVLPKVTADTMRLNIAAQVAANFTDKLRPFATLAIRHDFGDGDTGGAADYGGGIEWNSQQFQARIEARSQAQGSGADEDYLNFTVRRTSGTGIAPYARWNANTATAGAKLERERFSLGIEAGVTDNAMQFKNLLSGEWRF